MAFKLIHAEAAAPFASDQLNKVCRRKCRELKLREIRLTFHEAPRPTTVPLWRAIGLLPSWAVIEKARADDAMLPAGDYTLAQVTEWRNGLMEKPAARGDGQTAELAVLTMRLVSWNAKQKTA